MVAPLLVGASTLAVRAWGPRTGGVLSAFPAIVGPVLLIAALNHGSAFAARTADGTLYGLASFGAFALAYGWAALRIRWEASLAVGWVGAAAAAGIIAVVHGLGSPPGVVVAGVALAIAWAAMPARANAAGAVAVSTRTSLPARMIVTALPVCALSAAADHLGPLIGGVLAALPLLASVMAVFTHRERGPAAAVALLRGMLVGMVGFVAFCHVVAALIVGIGALPAFAMATCAAVAAQIAAAYWAHPRRQNKLACALSSGAARHSGPS
jgi:hypothetical protein